MSLNWLQQQRSTPSFASVKGSGASEQLGTALDQPMPAVLQEFGPSSAAGDDLFVAANTSSISRLSAADVSSSPYSVGSPFSGSGARSSSRRRAKTPAGTTLLGSSVPRSRSATGGSGYTSKIADSSRGGVARHIDVFESLVERGKLSAEAKDRMRIEAEKEKLRRCRSVPKINRMNDDNSMPSTNSIFQRLWNKDQEKKLRHQTKVLIMQKKEEELFATLFQPRISNRGHRSKGSANRATSTEKFSFKTQQRMEEIRKEKIMKEMEMMMETPDINPKSKLLAQRQREREGLAGYSHIEAMLERDRLNKLARYEQHERELISQNPGTPRITEYAASLHRGNESASERLYKAALQQRSKTPNTGTPISRGGGDEDRNAPLSLSSMSSIYMNGSATPSQRRRAGDELEETSSIARRAHTPDLSRLFQNDAQMRARREERARQILEAESGSHTPAINPVSASIAARLPTTTEERLTATTPRRTGATRLSSASIASSAAPSEGARERERERDDAPTSRDLQLFERLRIAEARRKMRIEAARAELEQRREEECTFAPVTTTSYYPPPSVRQRQQQKQEEGASASSNSGRGPAGLYERSSQWLQSRDERLKQMKEAEEEAKNSGFSFQPAISRKTQEIYEKGVYSERAVPTEEAVAGFDSFVSRQQKAKRSSSAEEEEREAAYRVSAKPWNSSTQLSKAERERREQDEQNSSAARGTSEGSRFDVRDLSSSYKPSGSPPPPTAARNQYQSIPGSGFASIYDKQR